LAMLQSGDKHTRSVVFHDESDTLTEPAAPNNVCLPGDLVGPLPQSDLVGPLAKEKNVSPLRMVETVHVSKTKRQIPYRVGMKKVPVFVKQGLKDWTQAKSFVGWSQPFSGTPIEDTEWMTLLLSCRNHLIVRLRNEIASQTSEKEKITVRIPSAQRPPNSLVENKNEEEEDSEEENEKNQVQQDDVLSEASEVSP